MRKNSFLPVLIFCACVAQGQPFKKQDKALIMNLQQHVKFLADDRLEGRRTGTKGESLAAQYISAEFQKAGLLPGGTSGYLQSFEINEGKQVNKATYLSINGETLVLMKDFFPLVPSPNVTIHAFPAVALQEPGMPWFYDIHELIEENVKNPHFDINAEMENSVREINKKGATAVILFNSSTREDGINFNSKDRTSDWPIPVLYVTREAAKKYFKDLDATLEIKLKTDISEKKRTGINVAGRIDNGALHTVVLGAHYDHLGFGEDGNSRETETGKLHNGADDNASGTAALLELAKMIKKARLKHNNYIFIAFSGEELGLFGSKYYTEHPTVDMAGINYMINMDMVGRLNDSTHLLTVGGYGTSPSWGALYGRDGKKRLYSENLHFHFDSSGTGPSDHTSFYLKNIPVLFYFSGLHSDYHKASDDFDKLNYTGEMFIVKHIFSLIETEDKAKSKLVFAKTRETLMTSSPRFTVTLGIMPDYTFSGTGVRIDGVSDNKPAQRAGLIAGDVITSLGEQKISTLENYMQVLATFKKGDKTKVIYTRGLQTLSSVVEF